MHLLRPTTTTTLFALLLSLTTALPSPTPQGTPSNFPKPDLSICIHQPNPAAARMLIVALTSPSLTSTAASIQILILDENCNPISNPITQTNPVSDYTTTIAASDTNPALGSDFVVNRIALDAQDVEGWEVDVTYKGGEEAKGNGRMYWNSQQMEGCSVKQGEEVMTLGCTFFSDTGFPF